MPPCAHTRMHTTDAGEDTPKAGAPSYAYKYFWKKKITMKDEDQSFLSPNNAKKSPTKTYSKC